MVSTPLLERLVSPMADVDGAASVEAEDALDHLRHRLVSLFNAAGLDRELDLQHFPHVARSVVNYGLGNMAGIAVSSIGLELLVRRIRQAIFDFEPSIVRRSLLVSPVDSGRPSACDLEFSIEGEIQMASECRTFHIRSSWNTESGEVRIRSLHRGRRDG